MYITGWTVLLALGAAIPATLMQSRDVAWLWVLGVLALAAIDTALAPPTRSLGLKRNVPGSVRLSESTSTVLHVANVSRRAVRGAVRDAWDPSAGPGEHRFTIKLGPGKVASFTTHLTPQRRGVRNAAPVTVRTTGPLRLGGRQRSLEVPAQLKVLPEFASRKHLPSRLARLRELDGVSPVLLRGQGSEFDSLREYVIGDDVRTIDWRATGRRADVIVRTYRPERDRRVFVVLDTSRLSAVRVGQGPALEASIEAALLLSALASRAGDRVQVVAFDRSERARAVGSSSPSLMPRLAQELATIQPSLVEPDWAALARLVDERISQRALVVLLTTVDPSLIDSGAVTMIRHLQAKHQVLVASVDDPEVTAMTHTRGSVEAVYEASAAARTLLEKAAVASRLRQFGAEVIQAAPDDLAPKVADTYLALKASGRL